MTDRHKYDDDSSSRIGDGAVTREERPRVGESENSERAPELGHTDEYHLAMAALDCYPIEDRLPKSTSVVFRIHQLGHAMLQIQMKVTEAFDDAVGIFESRRLNRPTMAT